MFLGTCRGNLRDGIAKGVLYPDARAVKADARRGTFDRDRAEACTIPGRENAHGVI